MKYIIIKTTAPDSPAREIPFIFPNDLVHLDVAANMERCIMQASEEPVMTQIVAAGFIDLSGIVCRGGSESLNKESRYKQDVNLILKHGCSCGIINNGSKIN